MISKSHLLHLGADDLFRAKFDKQPFLIEHDLCDHPLFDLNRILELAKQLPEDRVEYNLGDLPIGVDPSATPRNGLSVEDTIKRIETCKSWLVLKNVERDSDYNKLLRQCLDQVEPVVADLYPAMEPREGFIFLTSPGSVTPYHIDPEHNFLLQIRGSKTMRVWNGNDRSIISEAELDAFHAGASRNLVYRDELDQSAQAFELTPGVGLHVPVTFPHWVKNGPSVSVSFSITFRSKTSARGEIIHKMNHRLRTLGLKPKQVGQSPLLDSFKFNSFDLVRRAKNLVTGKDAESTGRAYRK